jgi:hypothetical protein
MSTFVDPFGHQGQSDMYALYRPRYPAALLSRIIAEAGDRGLSGLTVDVCTGTGQVRRVWCSDVVCRPGIESSCPFLGTGRLHSIIMSRVGVLGSSSTVVLLGVAIRVLMIMCDPGGLANRGSLRVGQGLRPERVAAQERDGGAEPRVPQGRRLLPPARAPLGRCPHGEGRLVEARTCVSPALVTPDFVRLADCPGAALAGRASLRGRGRSRPGTQRVGLLAYIVMLKQ